MNRNSSASKKKLKTIVIIIASALAVMLAFVCAGPYVLTLLQSDDVKNNDYDDMQFFPVEEGKDILTDKVYLTLDSAIYYSRYGETVALNEKTLEQAHPAASFFYNYFNCIKNGDYQIYPSFYTSECYNHKNFNRPKSFTKQGIYDINIKLHSINVDDVTNTATETYTVSYRIFENNGTYRKDVLPGKLLVRVFEIKIDNGNIKISNVGYASK